TPAAAYPLNLAITGSPRDLAFSFSITTIAAAPSFIGQLFPAVTTPSFLNGVESIPRASNEVFALIHSSLENTTLLPFPAGTATGMTWSSKYPESQALDAF